MLQIRPVTPTDAGAWLRLRHDLWPDDSLDEHRKAIERFFAGERHEPKEVLLAAGENVGPVGLVELSIRNIVDSCVSDHVGYLEGWYVDPSFRRRGVGRALIGAAEQWALAQGCTEFASDALIENEVSLTAHRALGFAETSRVCNFRKDLRAGA
jgi:aminoglycoside 6'-N-acetyltransferase I